MKRILLLSDTFPPDLGVGGRRWERLCSVLCHDYEFTVIAGSFDASGVFENRLANGGVYRVVYPRMRLSNFIATRNPKTSKNKDAPEQPGEGLKATGKGGWRIKYARVFDYLRACRELIPWIDLNRSYARKVFKLANGKWHQGHFDLIIASSPESGNLIAANRLNKKWNIPWVAEFRDPWAESYHCPFKANGWLHNMLKKFEARTIRSASSVVTINKELANLIASGNQPVDIVPTSMSGDVRVDPARGRASGECCRLGYAGCVVDKSDYHLLARALKRMGTEEIRGISWSHWGPNNVDFPMRHSLGIEGLKKINYHHCGNIDHVDLIQNLRTCDYNVIFGYNGRSSQCIWSGKIFDYLSVGRPILMIGGSSDSALYHLLSKAAKGYWLKDEDEVVRFLKGDEPRNDCSMRFDGDMRELESYSLGHTSVQMKGLINQVLQCKEGEGESS